MLRTIVHLGINNIWFSHDWNRREFVIPSSPHGCRLFRFCKVLGKQLLIHYDICNSLVNMEEIGSNCTSEMASQSLLKLKGPETEPDTSYPDLNFSLWDEEAVVRPHCMLRTVVDLGINRFSIFALVAITGVCDHILTLWRSFPLSHWHRIL